MKGIKPEPAEKFTESLVRLDAAQLYRLVQGQRLTVWDGVKVGFGIYIVLPVLLVVSFILLYIITGISIVKILQGLK